ncbi:unnamed protein product [Brassica oleracea]
MIKRYWNIDLEEMMRAGVHFGHGTRKWNPRMAPYISAKRKASRGKQFLIVGTKNKAADLVSWAAIRARCHYVNKKWLGGMLTNWSTTEKRLHKFRDLRTEQKTEGFNRLPKRDAAVLKRQLSRLETYLGGIKYMTGLPDITGKTAVATDTILNQQGQNVICVYVAIGQKASSVAQVVTSLQERGAMDYTIVVAETADSPATLQYLAPYTGAALAEYFMYRDQHTLIFMMIFPNKHKLIDKCLFYYEDRPGVKLIQEMFFIYIHVF